MSTTPKWDDSYDWSAGPSKVIDGISVDWTPEERLQLIAEFENRFVRHLPPTPKRVHALLEALRFLAGSSAKFLEINRVNIAACLAEVAKK